MILTLDTRPIRDHLQLHAWFADALAFPAYYGRNLDALHDMLTARAEPLALTVLYADDFRARFGGYAESVFAILQDSAAENPSLHISIFSKASGADE